MNRVELSLRQAHQKKREVEVCLAGQGVFIGFVTHLNKVAAPVIYTVRTNARAMSEKAQQVQFALTDVEAVHALS